MIDKNVIKSKGKQTPLKSASWRSLIGIRSLKWIMFAQVFALLLFGHCFSYDEWQVPAGQPEQIWSKVDYDPNLTDPFFESDEWSYPYWIIKHPNGHFESTRSEDESPIKEPPRLKHTANCFSTAFLGKHLVKFCEAKLLDVNMIDLFIQETNAAFFETLRVQIRDREFTCKYFGGSGKPSPGGLTCATKRQQLTLDKKDYRKGDVIKGRIDFECVWESTDPKRLEEYRRNPRSIKFYGVFKTIVE